VDFKIFPWLLLKISQKNSLRSNLTSFMPKCKFLDVSHISSYLATAVFFDAGNVLHFQFLPKHAFLSSHPTLLSSQIGPSAGSHHRSVAYVAKVCFESFTATEFEFVDCSSDLDIQLTPCPKDGQVFC